MAEKIEVYHENGGPIVIRAEQLGRYREKGYQVAPKPRKPVEKTPEPAEIEPEPAVEAEE